MEATEKELIQWAESYQPAENSMQLSPSTYIEDMRKCIGVLLSRVKARPDGVVHDTALDDLREIWQKVQELSQNPEQNQLEEQLQTQEQSVLA